MSERARARKKTEKEGASAQAEASAAVSYATETQPREPTVTKVKADHGKPVAAEPSPAGAVAGPAVAMGDGVAHDVIAVRQLRH